MYVQLALEPSRSLPPLAWCARLTAGSTRAQLVCGRAVETWDGRAFFEGAWAGDFASADFDRAAHVFGSGAVARDGRVTFVTPSHTCERLQWVRSGGQMWVSNSLCMLLAAAGTSLRPGYAGYARDFADIIHGVGHFRRQIPTADGRRVELVYFRNLEVAPDLSVRYPEKPAVEAFADFAGYERLLLDVLAGVAANARDAGRAGGAYELLTSVSSGYDSAACAALGRRIGCERAVTLSAARGARNASEGSDSGVEVARAMGLAVTEYSRLHYQSDAGDHCPEAEFLATGMSGEDVNLLPFEGELPGTVFLTGFHGDKVWDKHVRPNAALKRGDLSGASLGEFRLRVNFVHVPVPFVGALRHADVHAISNSPATAPWSIGGDYDRPTTRRLAEEAGAPREAFGQSKKATTALLHLYGTDAMSPGTSEGVRRFAERTRLSPLARLAFRADAWRERAGFFAFRALRKLGLLPLVPALQRKAFGVHSHTPQGPLPMIWAVERIRAERYSAAVAPLQPATPAPPLPDASDFDAEAATSA